MKSAHCQYWVIAQPTTKKRRWVINSSLEDGRDFWHTTEVRLWGRRTKSFSWPDVPPVLNYESFPQDGPQDVPSPLDKIFVVSERAKAFFATEAPGALAYYPIALKGPQCESLPNYYACRFRHVWDCLHPYAWDMNGKRRYVAYPVVDISKIPKNGKIGSIKHFEVQWLIRDDLKKKFEKAGLTGIHFRDWVADSNNPAATNFTHVNHPRDPHGLGSGTIESSSSWKLETKRKPPARTGKRSTKRTTK